MEELDSITKILDPKTPIVWLKEIMSSELWEEELFQGGDATTTWTSDDMDPTITPPRAPPSDPRNHHQGVATFVVEW